MDTKSRNSLDTCIQKIGMLSITMSILHAKLWEVNQMHYISEPAIVDNIASKWEQDCKHSLYVLC